MNRPHLTSLTLIFVFGVTCTAAEPPPSFLAFTLEGGTYPGIDHSRYDSGHTDWDTNGRSLDLSATYRFSHEHASSLYVQGGLFHRTSSGEEEHLGLTSISLRAYGFQFGLGYSYNRNNFYSLEIGPRLGFGRAAFTEDSAGIGRFDSSTGGYYSGDLSLRNYWHVHQALVGITLGVATWSSSVNFPATSMIPAGSADYEGTGGYIALLVGYAL